MKDTKVQSDQLTGILVVVGILIVCFIIGRYLYNCNKNATVTNKTEQMSAGKNPLIPNKCVCAFDIDYTITCGNPRPFVEKCIAHGCRLAINTARPVKYIKDVDLDSISFTQPNFSDDDFYYNPNSYSQTAESAAEVKSTFLNLLNDKYSINNKKCVVLLDDHKTNIKVANEQGFSTIKAKPTKGLNCGLPEKELESLEAILQGC